MAKSPSRGGASLSQRRWGVRTRSNQVFNLALYSSKMPQALKAPQASPFSDRNAEIIHGLFAALQGAFVMYQCLFPFSSFFVLQELIFRLRCGAQARN